MLESLHISIPSRHSATPPFPPSPSLRASSFKSSDGSIAPLRRSSSVIGVIPETDSTLDNSLKGELFKIAIVKILIKLKLTTWKLSEAEHLHVKNIASALTNSVYLIILEEQKLLLRVYGPNVLHLIDREYETSVLARLAHHRIGPRLLGQFKNGRIEQWLESVEVTADEIREATISQYIARRLREFHDYVTLLPAEQGKVSAKVNLDSWVPALPKAKLSPSIKQFIKHVKLYRNHVKHKEGEIVFCHNDLQYGNLLRVKGDEHHCLAVIDFEYAGPNPRAFDIANHFIEWMADYHEGPSHELNTDAYPSYKESENFLAEYIRYGKLIARREDPIVFPEETQSLRDQVDLWRAMSHAQWAIWGIVQALPPKEEIATKQTAEVLRHEIETRKSGSTIDGRSNRSLPSPVPQGMRSPFLPPGASPRMGLSKRSSSYKSPGYFALATTSVVLEEADADFSLGESAVSVPSQGLTRAPSHPFIDSDDDDNDDDRDGQGRIDGSTGRMKEDAWIDEEESGGFDYIAYSNERIALFYGEVTRLGLLSESDIPEGFEIKRLPESALQP